VQYLIVVDFDGTITELDTQDGLLERHAPEAYAEAERGLADGRLTLRECMQMEFAPVRGDHDAIVAETVAAAHVRPGFTEFVRAAEERGHRVVVVSGGFESVIRPVLEREGVAHLPVIAHEFQITPEGTTIDFRADADCDVCGEECKRAVVAGLRDGLPVVYIGDGYSDRCAALAADRRFARRFLAEDLDRLGVAYTPFDDFHTIREALLGPDPVGPAPG
jgi:HAD superfamily phosphoserine phosphatase-like hydrolase